MEAATGIRIGFARLLGDVPSDEQYTAVDSATASKVFDIGVVSGAVEQLDDQGVFVDDDEAEARNLAVGDVLTFGFLNGQTRQLTVRGIFTEDELAGNFVVNQELHEWTGVDQFDLSVYIALADGVSEEAARPAIAALTDPYANADLLSRDEYLDQQSAQIDPLVNLMYALLVLAIGIALFSIANSMALSIHERTREIGLLRSVGMTRAQLRSTVRWESVLVALLGTGTGLVLGVFFGWAISVTVRGDGLTAFVLPVLQIIVIGVLAVVGTLLAATRPAWRGSRLDVLRAISSE